jgi:TonB family protein
MRVLVVDQDSASNEAIARSLRELYTVDAVTNKGDCLDLLRSNTFEVIVASERLEDGSGLELLGQIAKRWPSVLRIFAADRQRLQLLKGRLGPFELFQTLTYPIDPERLIATLNLADAIQDAHADTSNIQHVVLSGEPSSEAPEEIEQAAESARSGEFPVAQPNRRAASMEHAEAAPKVSRSAVRVGASHRVRSVPGQRPRGNGAAGPPTTAPEVRRPLRHGRSRGTTNRAPPVRFPPLERSPPLEPPQVAGRSGASQTDSFAEAAAMARAARSNFEGPPEDFDTKRLAVIVGGGAAVVLAVVVLGFKLFGSKSEAPRPAAAPAVHAPEYPQEVVDLVAQIESALKGDDFKSARADVDRLRQMAPSHPRLAFFDGLLAQRIDASKGFSAASARGTVKRGAQSSTAVSNSTPKGTPPTSPPPSNPPSHTSAAATSNAATRPADSGANSRSTTVAADESAATHTAGLAPETPPGLTRPSHEADAPAPSARATGSSASATESAPAAGSASPSVFASGTGHSAPATTPVSGAESPSTDASAPPASSASASTSAIRRASSGEPPPVVREAKLIRNVIPDYPSAAKRDGIKGFVDLDVRISSRGVVEDVSVLRATPPDVFEKSAVAAVRKWKYDPRFVDGLPSEAHVKVHLEFGPGK